jgi:hypothetical protein
MASSKQHKLADLEEELTRLNALVRERRAQLDRLRDCPNTACPCRVVWRDHVEKNLASQVRRIRKQVRGGPAGVGNPKSEGRKAKEVRNPKPEGPLRRRPVSAKTSAD